MRHEYEAWERRVAGYEHYDDGEVIQFHPNEIQSGRYRYTSRATGQDVPVAFWVQDNKVVCRYGTALLNGGTDGRPALMIPATALGHAGVVVDVRALEIWPYCLKRPISNEVYCSVIQRGRQEGNQWLWPDTPRGAGDNKPPEGLEAYHETVFELARDAKRIVEAGAAKTQEAADYAANLATLLSDTVKRGEELRKAEKKPHKDAAEEVDLKWAPDIAAATENKIMLKEIVITPFEILKRADQKKREAEAMQKGQDPTTVARHRTTSGTRKPVALKTTKAAEIVDWDAAVHYFRGHEAVRAAAQVLANAMARAGVGLPAWGKVVETQKAV